MKFRPAPPFARDPHDTPDSFAAPLVRRALVCRLRHRDRVVEGIGPAQHLVQHAVLQHRSGRRGDAAGFRRAVDFPRARPQVRRHAAGRASASTRGSPRSRCSRSAGLSPPAPSTTGPWSASPARADCPRPPRAWHDAVFNQPLSFYLFDLPFYSLLRGYVLALVIVCILVYWVAARGWQLRHSLPDLRDARELDPGSFTLEGGLESRFLRGAVRGPAARPRAQVLPGPLRDGLQRARQLPGRHRLRRPEHRAAAAMAGDLRLPRRRRVRLDGPLVPRRPAWRSPWWWISPPPGWSARFMCGPTRSRSSGPTSRRHIHATRSAFGIEHAVQGGRVQGPARGPHRRRGAQADSRQCPAVGHARVP